MINLSKGGSWFGVKESRTLSSLLSMISSKSGIKISKLYISVRCSWPGRIVCSSIILMPCNCLPSLLLPIKCCVFSSVITLAWHLGLAVGWWILKWNGWNMFSCQPVGQWRQQSNECLIYCIQIYSRQTYMWMANLANRVMLATSTHHANGILSDNLWSNCYIIEFVVLLLGQYCLLYLHIFEFNDFWTNCP